MDRNVWKNRRHSMEQQWLIVQGIDIIQGLRKYEMF